MKKQYLLFFFSLMGFAAAAQNTSAKFSPQTKKYLAAVQELKSTRQLPQGFIYKRTAEGKIMVSALVRITQPHLAQQGIESLGAHIGTQAGNIWTVQVPTDKMNAFVQLGGIDYIQVDEPVYPNLNIARKTTRVDSVHMGYGLPMPYSGKNVIVGVIDFGFDYNHPTFFDTSGHHYRIKRVWELNTVGTPPAGFSYGHEMTDTSLIKAQGTDNTEQTHGSSTAGMAAGSGYGGTPNNKFRGMAYEADLVLVGVRRDTIAEQWMSGGFSDFVDGISYIFNYATTVGKPAVVNISWGSHSGPHDGTNLFNQACNSLSGPGKIIVMSAGNEGQEKIHLQKTFTPVDTVMNTFLSFTPATYKRTWVDIWGDTSKTFCAKVTLYSGGGTVGNTTGYICLDDTTHNFYLIGANGTDTCEVEFINSTSEYNAKPRMTINIFNHATDSICVTIKGTDGKIDLWDEYYYYGYTYQYQSSFTSLGYLWASVGNTVSTTSDMGAAASVLMVGAYASKVNFTDINGNPWTYSGYTSAGSLVPFSSRGPLADGRIKPDITAPGLTIATAHSSYDTSYTPTGSNSSLVIDEYTDPVSTKKYYYCEFSGTSASAPATSGIVALMLQANPNLDPNEVKNVIFATAIKDSHTGTLPPQGNNNWGHGKINAYGAVKKVLQDLASVHAFDGEEMDAVIYPNPNNGRFTLDYTAKTSGQIAVNIFDLTGQQVYTETRKVNIGNNQMNIDLHELPAGVYLVNVNANTGTMSSKIIIR